MAAAALSVPALMIQGRMSFIYCFSLTGSIYVYVNAIGY